MKIAVRTSGRFPWGYSTVCLFGWGLQQAGYTVRLAVPERFVAFVGAHGLEVAPLRGDVQAVMAGETGRAFMQTGGANPLKSIRTIRTLITPIVMEMTRRFPAACRDVDALICLGVFSVFGHAVAEALDMPILHVEPTPLLPSRAFPRPWPLQKGWGGLHNYLSGLAMLGVIWLWYRPFVNDFRRNLGLPKLGAIRAYCTFLSHPHDWRVQSPDYPPSGGLARERPRHRRSFSFMIGRLAAAARFGRVSGPRGMRRSTSVSAAWPARTRRNWPGWWRRPWPSAASGVSC